jgi:predicted dehydrogenase
MEPVRVGIIGVTGFGRDHLAWLGECERRGIARLEAAAIINPEQAADVERSLRDHAVRIYRTAEELLEKERGNIDLIDIPTGIAYHAPLSIQALEAGFHVFCEKPAAGTAEEARAMKRARDRAGKILAIGYQNVSSHSIRRIKEITLSGEYGKLLQVKTSVRWPRAASYYARNAWAGKLAANGKRIYDSPLQNAVSHYLQNMIYVAGPDFSSSAIPVEVYGENYRAKDIESADTQFIRIYTGNGGPVLTMAASHAVPDNVPAVTEFRYEEGLIIWEQSGSAAVYRLEDPKRLDPERIFVESFDNGGANVHLEGMADVLLAVRDGREPRSTIDNAIQHTVCIEAAFASSGGVHRIPDEFTRDLAIADPEGTTDPNIAIVGIDVLMDAMFRTNTSFAESGAPWGVKGELINVSDETE